MLQRAGYRVVTVEHGQQVLSVAPGLAPDLILLDIAMPIMDGMETAAALRADPHLHKLPLIAFTAQALKGDPERFLALGFAAYLAKPFAYAELLHLVANLLARPRRVG